MSTLLAGYAEAIINPDQELCLEGYEYRGSVGAGNSGILDNLYAKVLSLSLEHTSVLLLTLDVCEFSIDLGKRLRKSISTRTGIELQNIHIFATHTHSGPILDMRWGARDLAGVLRDQQELLLSHYINKLEEIVCTISLQSRSTIFPVQIHSAHHKAKLGYNRRKQGSASTTATMLYSLWENPDVHPDGLYDEDIPVVLLERIIPDQLDRYLGPLVPDTIVIFNPSFHPVVLGQDSRLVSADYPGAACSYLSKYFGYNTKSIFLLGASGDTHPMISTQMNAVAVEVTGCAVATGIVLSLADRKKEISDFLFIKETILPLSSVAAESLCLTIIAIGSIAILAASAELFTEFGIILKSKSPFKTTLIGSLSDGTIGYIPSQNDFSGGEYEIEIALKHGIEPGTMNLILEKSLELLNEAYQSLHC